MDEVILLDGHLKKFKYTPTMQEYVDTVLTSTKGATETFDAVPTPLNGNDLKTLKEGELSLDYIKIYTKKVLNGAIDKEITQIDTADVFKLVNNRPYYEIADLNVYLLKRWFGEDSSSGDIPVGFNPTNIESLILWLDGLDASTISKLGSYMHEWKDKSKEKNNATQDTLRYQCEVTDEGIVFNDSWMEIPLIDVAEMLFIVQNVKSTSVENALIGSKFGDYYAIALLKSDSETIGSAGAHPLMSVAMNGGEFTSFGTTAIEGYTPYPDKDEPDVINVINSAKTTYGALAHSNWRGHYTIKHIVAFSEPLSDDDRASLIEWALEEAANNG